MADVKSLPTFDISNEGWREYVYPGNQVLRVIGAKKLILEKRSDGDRHRLVVKDIVSQDENAEVGYYIKPGWLAIRWQTPDGKHGIEF